MWHRRVLNFRVIYNVTHYAGYLSTQFAELECCQATPDTSGNPVCFQWGFRKYPGNTDRDEIVGGNNDVKIWISMLTEICSSGFERLVYKFSHSVGQASVCFVHKVYKFLHARVYPVISWQLFSTIGIIQWANKHEMEFVLNFYVANLTLALCIIPRSHTRIFLTIPLESPNRSQSQASVNKSLRSVYNSSQLGDIRNDPWKQRQIFWHVKNILTIVHGLIFP